MIRSVTLVSTLATCLSLYATTGAPAVGIGRLLVQPFSSVATRESSTPAKDQVVREQRLLTREYSGPSPARWKFYRSPDGRFTARFPTNPVLQTSNVSGTPMKIVQSATESAAYMLMYMKFDTRLSSEMRKKALAGAVHGVAGQGKLVSVTPRFYQGNSARDVILEKDIAGRPAICDDLIFIAGNRLYQVMTVIPRGTDDPANTRVFQRGFRLTGN